ncbi:hypothetical protein BV898_17259 [Hypsibius exemplaris]|uniref:Kazal-like domain-containing protein n=1 Tax=Hypsibius exemplaris TaxID=2072580 RepID=A0A9X6NHR2_HYPEX|nr:hypothetical protein BV898_17259 [Hypsibius exemplaris]
MSLLFPNRLSSTCHFAWIVLFLFSPLGSDSAAVPENRQEPVGESCECPSDSSMPVCGTNGKTYDSFCKLRCASRFIPALGGKCRGSCPCPAASPMTKMMCDLSDGLCPANIPKGQICGTDNITHADSCKFICAQQFTEDLGVQCGGACPCAKAGTECSRCTEEYTPICGTNGITYGNQCMFACARLTIKELFPSCRQECPCSVEVSSSPQERDIAFGSHLKQAFLVIV